MMNKKRSSRYHLLRYVVLGAIMGVAVLSLNFTKAIARTEKVAKNIAAITFSKDTTKPAVAPVPPVPPPPPPAPPAPVKGKKMPPPPPPVPAVPAGTAVPPVPPVPAVPAAPAAPAAPVAPDEHIAEPAKQGITLRSQMTAPPLYFVDGVNMGHQAPADLRPEEIESISVFKGEHAVQYGEDGKNGVIFIYTKGYNSDTKVKTINTSFDYKAAGAAPTSATSTSTFTSQQPVVKVTTNNNTNTHTNSVTKVNTNVNAAVTNTDAPTKTVVNTKVNTATKVNADTKVNVDTADSKSENK